MPSLISAVISTSLGLRFELSFMLCLRCCGSWPDMGWCVSAGDVGFHRGRPLAAMVIFRCCLQWKAFQADRTSLFDKIINTMGTQVLFNVHCSPNEFAVQILPLLLLNT